MGRRLLRAVICASAFILAGCSGTVQHDALWHRAYNNGYQNSGASSGSQYCMIAALSDVSTHLRQSDLNDFLSGCNAGYAADWGQVPTSGVRGSDSPVPRINLTG
jgi:hypothetical protein